MLDAAIGAEHDVRQRLDGDSTDCTAGKSRRHEAYAIAYGAQVKA